MAGEENNQEINLDGVDLSAFEGAAPEPDSVNLEGVDLQSFGDFESAPVNFKKVGTADMSQVEKVNTFLTGFPGGTVETKRASGPPVKDYLGGTPPTSLSESESKLTSQEELDEKGRVKQKPIPPKSVNNDQLFTIVRNEALRGSPIFSTPTGRDTYVNRLAEKGYDRQAIKEIVEVGSALAPKYNQAKAKLQQNPQDVQSMYELGNIALATRDYNGAEKEFSQVANSDDPNIALMGAKQMGRVALIKGDNLKALNIYQNLAQTNPDDPEISQGLARVMYMMGETSASQDLQKQAKDQADYYNLPESQPTNYEQAKKAVESGLMSQEAMDAMYKEEGPFMTGAGAGPAASIPTPESQNMKALADGLEQFYMMSTPGSAIPVLAEGLFSKDKKVFDERGVFKGIEREKGSVEKTIEGLNAAINPYSGGYAKARGMTEATLGLGHTLMTTLMMAGAAGIGPGQWANPSVGTLAKTYGFVFGPQLLSQATGSDLAEKIAFEPITTASKGVVDFINNNIPYLRDEFAKRGIEVPEDDQAFSRQLMSIGDLIASLALIGSSEEQVAGLFKRARKGYRNQKPSQQLSDAINSTLDNYNGSKSQERDALLRSMGLNFKDNVVEGKDPELAAKTQRVYESRSESPIYQEPTDVATDVVPEDATPEKVQQIKSLRQDSPIDQIPNNTAVEYNGMGGFLTRDAETGEYVFVSGDGKEYIIAGGGDLGTAESLGVTPMEGYYKDKHGEFYVRRHGNGFMVYKIGENNTLKPVYTNDKGNLQRRDAIINKALDPDRNPSIKYTQELKDQAAQLEAAYSKATAENRPSAAALGNKLDETRKRIADMERENTSVDAVRAAQDVAVGEIETRIQAVDQDLASDIPDAVKPDLIEEKNKLEQTRDEIVAKDVPDEVPTAEVEPTKIADIERRNTFTKESLKEISDGAGLAKKGTEILNPEKLSSKLKVGDKIIFYAERERTGVWDGKYVREDKTNNPFGILAILSSTDGYIKNKSKIDAELTDIEGRAKAEPAITKEDERKRIFRQRNVDLSEYFNVKGSGEEATFTYKPRVLQFRKIKEEADKLFEEVNNRVKKELTDLEGRSKAEPSKELPVITADELKTNPKALEGDPGRYTVGYPESFQGMGTNVRALESQGYTNLRTGDLVIFDGDRYVVKSVTGDNKKPNTWVSLIRVDEQGKLLREGDKTKAEAISFNTSKYSEEKTTGTKVAIPGFEDIDLVLVEKGGEYSIHELATGMKLVDTKDAKTPQEAINIAKKKLTEKNVTADNIYGKIYSSEQTLGDVKAINESKAYEKFKASKIAEDEKLPFVHSESERKALLDLAEKAKQENLPVAQQMIETAANRKVGKYTGAKLSIEGANEIIESSREKQVKLEAKNEQKPYPQEYIEASDATEDSFKKEVDQGRKVSMYDKIPGKLRKNAFEAWQKLIAIKNKYGYVPKELEFTINDVEVNPVTGLGAYTTSLKSKNLEAKASRLAKDEASINAGVEKINNFYNKEFGSKSVGEVIKEQLKPKEVAVKPAADIGVEVDQAEAQAAMDEIANRLVQIEGEFSKRGLSIETDYDNQIIVLDKDGNLVDPESVPDELVLLAGEYENAVSKMGEYDNTMMQQALTNARGEEVDYEEVEPELPAGQLEAKQNKIANKNVNKIAKEYYDKFPFVRDGSFIAGIKEWYTNFRFERTYLGKEVLSKDQVEQIKKWAESKGLEFTGETKEELRDTIDFRLPFEKPESKPKAIEAPIEEVVPEFSQEEIDKAEDARREELKRIGNRAGYAQQIIHDNFSGIRMSDWEQYGDRNWLKGDSKYRAKFKRDYINEDALPIDTLATEISSISGVEVEPQDIIDYIIDREQNKGKGKYRKGRQEISSINEAKRAKTKEDFVETVNKLLDENNVTSIEDAENLRGFPLSDEEVDLLVEYFKNKENEKAREGVAAEGDRVLQAEGAVEQGTTMEVEPGIAEGGEAKGPGVEVPPSGAPEGQVRPEAEGPIKFARNDEDVKRIQSELDDLLGEFGGTLEMGGLSKIDKLVPAIAKIVQLGYYKIADVAKYLVEKGLNAALPYLKEAYRKFKNTYEHDAEVKTSLSGDKEIEDYDLGRAAGGLAEGPQRAAGGRELPGQPGGPGLGRRPPIRIANKENIPPISKESVVDGKYDIDETQRFGVNLAMQRFDQGGKGFLLADGAGVGKTREILVIAREMADKSKKPSLIVTLKAVIDDSIKKDSKALGLDMDNIEVGTYDDLRAGKIGKGDYGVVIFDESHNLKNINSERATAAAKIKRDHTVFASATPMDKPEHAVYFMAELTGEDPKKVESDLGIEVTYVADKYNPGEYRSFARFTAGFDTYIARLIDKRNSIIENGGMVRREYPFYGDVKTTSIPMPAELTKDINMINEIMDKRYEDRENIVIGRWAGEMTKLQGGRFLDNYSKIKKMVQNDKAGSGAKAIYMSKLRDLLKNEGRNRLEAIDKLVEPAKADHVLDETKKALAEGKKVVVVVSDVGDQNIKIGNEKNKEKYGYLERKITETLPVILKKKFEEAGIKSAEIYGGNRRIGSRNKYDIEMERFNKGDADVVVMTAKSGGTGINLDDTVGDKPRKMIIATVDYQGDVLEQTLGRVSRRNTASPAEVVMPMMEGAASDNNRRSKVAKKVGVLAAINTGKGDIDYERINLGHLMAQEEPGMAAEAGAMERPGAAPAGVGAPAERPTEPVSFVEPFKKLSDPNVRMAERSRMFDTEFGENGERAKYIYQNYQSILRNLNKAKEKGDLDINFEGDCI